MLLQGVHKPSLENLAFKLQGSLFKLPLYKSFMDMWLTKALELKKLKKPAKWLESLLGTAESLTFFFYAFCLPHQTRRTPKNSLCPPKARAGCIFPSTI
jgi:hypothetical protein